MNIELATIEFLELLVGTASIGKHDEWPIHLAIESHILLV